MNQFTMDRSLYREGMGRFSKGILRKEEIVFEEG